MTTFKELGLSEPVLAALREVGYQSPSPIQEQAIPSVLEGRDVIGQAQTGTGKTAAFALPLIILVAVAAGSTWVEIAQHLGCTPQSAHRRYRWLRHNEKTGEVWLERPLPI